MSTIRNNNTTGGGMYAPSQGINTAVTNPNGITGVHQSNGAGGFSGNAEHFSTGNPFKPAPAPAPAPQQPAPAPDYSGQLNGIYNQLLGRDIRQNGLDYWSNDLANGASMDDVRANIMRGQEYADYQSAQNPPAPAPEMGGEMEGSPEENYKNLIASGCMPSVAAKHAINGTTPPGIPARPQRGGQYDTTQGFPPAQQGGGPMGVKSGPPPQTAAYGYPPQTNGGPMGTVSGPSGGPPQSSGDTGAYGGGPMGVKSGIGSQGGFDIMPGGPMGVKSGGPPQTAAYGYGQQGGPMGNNLLNSWNGGQQGGNDSLLSNLLGQQGRYGYGQGSNVSMLQALMGNGGRGYGDFLSQLLARYGR